MRHLFVTNVFPRAVGGVGSYLVALSAGLDLSEVVVVAPTVAGHEEFDRGLSYPVVRLPSSRLGASRSNIAEVVSAARTHESEVVHFMGVQPLGRMAGPVGKEADLPVSVFVGGAELYGGVGTRLLRRTLTSADLVLCFDDHAAQRLASSVAGLDIRVVPPSVDVERFSLLASGAAVREEYGLASRFVVLFVSRLVKRKGADVLLHAMSSVEDAVAVIVGRGAEEQALQRLAGELEVADRTVFAGEVPYEWLPAYYAAADVFCVPGAGGEGGSDLGIVYLEAAASGLACVAGRSPASSETVKDGTTGFLLDSPDPRTLAEVLARLQSDDTLRIRMGAAGRMRVEEARTPEVQAAKLNRFVSGVSAAVTS